jgi:tRNA dimethylallyltransferase
MVHSPYDLITVLGHTAAGKTAFAAHLAHKLGGEIISADSRQVYKDMDLGTGKDYADYVVDGKRVPVHLIDRMEAGYEYNVYLFKHDFLKAYTEITDRKLTPILCGGSGLYIESVLRNYKLLDVPVNKALREDLEKKSYEELEGILRLYGPPHNVTDTVSRKRMIRAIEIGMFQASQPEKPGDQHVLNPVVFGIRFERTVRRKRITERLQHRLEAGMLEEVEGLMKKGVTAEKMEYYGLEYRFISRYLMKQMTYDEMFRALNTAIHQFAKRQMTYFRGMERRGIPIHWIDGQLSMEEKVAEVLLKLPGQVQDEPDQAH